MKGNLIPRYRKNLMRKKKKLRSNLLSTGNSSRLASIERSLTDIEQELICSHEEQLHRGEIKTFNKIKKDCIFFNFDRLKSQFRRPTGPLIFIGNTLTDPVETVETLKSNFESDYCLLIEKKLM